MCVNVIFRKLSLHTFPLCNRTQTFCRWRIPWPMIKTPGTREKEFNFADERFVYYMKRLISFIKELSQKMKDDRATGLAAEQSYYYMLAMFPAMILLFSIIPYLSLSPEEVISTLNDFMPAEIVSLLEDTVTNLVINKSGILLAAGIIGTLWSASKGMQAFIYSMNVAFEVDESRNFILSRIVSILLTIGLLFAFIVVLVLPVFGDVLLNLTKMIIPIPAETEILFTILRWTIALCVIILILSLLYYFAPAKQYPFKQVIPGAMVASVLWLAISFGFSFYVSNFSNYSSTYGGLAGVIILLIWLYYSGLAFVLGGEINALLHKRFSLEYEKKKKSETEAEL